MDSKFDKLCEAYLSKGLLKAYMGGGNLKHICPKCGLMVPKYKGRYGTICPVCKTRILNDPNPVCNQDNGELAEVPDEMIDATDDENEM